MKFILLCLFLSSCATPVIRQTTRTIRTQVKQGNYKQALKFVQTEKSYKEKKSRLLYHMEQGLIYHLMGHYQKSIDHLGKAKSIHQKLYTISLKKKLQTIITNETVDIYYGEVFERSLLHFYQALNHFSLYQRGSLLLPKGKEMMIKKLSQQQKRTHLLSARAEVVSWDSFLDSQQESRRGKSIFKNDLLSKTFGAFIHEALNSPSENQIALQLYKDAKKILFRNYNSYKTYNLFSKKFKFDFKKLPRLGKKKVEKNYVNSTPFSEQLTKYLNFKILELTKKVRPLDMKNMIRVHQISKETVDKVASTPPSNVAFVIQRGIIPPKIAFKQHYSLERALTPDNPTLEQRKWAKVGSFIIMAYAANELGLFPPANRYDPLGAEIGVRLADYSTSGLAISFELPKIQNKKIGEEISLEIYDKNKVLAYKGPLSIVAPLGDIAEEAVAEYSAALYPKLGARLAMKHMAAIFASYLTYQSLKESNNYNYFAKLAAVAQYMVVAKTIENSEKADTRYWSTLPSNIRIGNAYLKKGKYAAKIVFTKKINGQVQKRISPLGLFTIDDDKKKKILNYRVH